MPPLFLAVAAAAAAALAAPASAAQPDYSRPEAWLCLPGEEGPCDSKDLAFVDVTASGVSAPVPVVRPDRPPIDCFYVYPTVSRQPGGNADATLTDDERYVAEQQIARYGQVCRVFAPLYRQVTLGAIAGLAAGDGEMAYADVASAWAHYISFHNEGRGVLLVGHSQGARHLAQLIATRITETPEEAKIVGAHIIGANILMPEGADRDGGFGSMPLCSAERLHGCVVAYVTFAADLPPKANARFGIAPRGEQVACVHPGALLGEEQLSGVYPTRPRAAGSAQLTAVLADVGDEAPSYRLNGLVSAACRTSGNARFLAVSSDSPRIMAGFRQIDAALPGWGLHLIDLNIAQETLVRLAATQAEAWKAARQRR
jgi:hypothetical protein